MKSAPDAAIGDRRFGRRNRFSRGRRIAAVLLLPPLLLLLLGVVLAFTALQSAPGVVLPVDPDHDDVARAITILREQDPRRRPGSSVHELSLSQRDLELLLNHAGQRWLKSTAQVHLSRDRAVLRASLHAPPNPFGRWINVEASLTQTGGLPELESLRIGRLRLPTALVEPAARWLAAQHGLAAQLEQAVGAVQEVGFEPQELQLRYVWGSGGGSRRLLAALVPPDDQRRLQVYNNRLAALLALQVGSGDAAVAAPPVAPGDPLTALPTLSLAPLLGPLFELARERAAAGADAADENRAALLVLTMLAIGRDIKSLLPDAASWPQVPRVQPTLEGRADLAQHLLVSAVIAAEGTSPLSRAVGVYKEVADSRGGTGFSFDDIAADRTGTRLGMMAVQDPDRLQHALVGGIAEAQLLPLVSDLPSNMTEPDFLRRFGGVDRPRYRAMIDRIDRRIDALAVWSRLGDTATR